MAYSSVVPALIDASKDAGMIVVGTQGLGALGRLLLGSVTTELLHHAPVRSRSFARTKWGFPTRKLLS